MTRTVSHPGCSTERNWQQDNKVLLQQAHAIRSLACQVLIKVRKASVEGRNAIKYYPEPVAI